MTEYFQKHLPHDSIFVRDAQCLHPSNKTKSNSLPAIGRLALNISKILQNTSLCTRKSPEEYANLVKREFSHYQTEDIPLMSDSPIDRVPIDQFWYSVGDFKGTDGKSSFSALSEVAQYCLCVSHGNAVPERGFSINKSMLEDRSSLKGDTIEALRLVKESIVLHGNQVRIQ